MLNAFNCSFALDVCYTIFCHLLQIHSGKIRNLSSLLSCSLWWVQIVGYHFGLQIVFVCLYSTPDIFCEYVSNIKHILSVIHYTICSKIKHILSVIQYTICGAVCFQFTHFPCDDWENIHTLSYYHYQTGSMNYYPLFRVRSWNNGVCCMTFYILMICKCYGFFMLYSK